MTATKLKAMTDFQAFVERDLTAVWHPCTQMKDHEKIPLIPIKKAQGVWLEDYAGNRYLDAISSWWVNLFGHSNPTINQAIIDQLSKLEHVLLAGFSHEPIIQLSEKLISITPNELKKCFYADNGSSAIEVALKMSFHYWQNTGHKNKTRFVNLSNSYHGETLGALAVGDVALYKDTYKPLLLDVITAPSPDSYLRLPGETEQECAERAYTAMYATLEQHHKDLCAVVLEPLVQCAGYMRMYHPIYLKLVRQACNEFNVHLIADEIAVGFGRTGTMFACEQAKICPDFLCLSKGITGGYLPLSVVLTTNEVYAAFYDNYENLTAFLHSHSYTGNALSCAAALATLRLFESSDVLKNNQRLSQRTLNAVHDLIEYPHVGDVRQCGMITAIELVKDKKTKQPFPWQQRRGLRVYEYGLKHGVLLRPLGNVVYFMPPYVITEDEIETMTRIARDGIKHAVE